MFLVPSEKPVQVVGVEEVVRVVEGERPEPADRRQFTGREGHLVGVTSVEPLPRVVEILVVVSLGVLTKMLALPIAVRQR